MTRPVFLYPWIALLWAASSFFGTTADAQPASSRKSAERLLEIPNLSPDEASAFMHRFRNTKLASDFVFDFHLKHIPARGRPTVYSGHLAGTWNQQGPLQRIELAEFDELADNNTSWLISGGMEPAIYEGTPVASEATEVWGRVEESRVASESLIPLTPITAFDLQLPFVFWENFEWVRSQRVLGRPAYIYDMRPATPIETSRGKIARVRLYIDADFAALLRAEYFDESDAQIRQLKVLSFKEVSGQWIPKVLDFVETGSREKVRFEVRAAALNQLVPRSVFDLSGNVNDSWNVSNLVFERL